jgi:hypothetical protein
MPNITKLKRSKKNMNYLLDITEAQLKEVKGERHADKYYVRELERKMERLERAKRNCSTKIKFLKEHRRPK